MRVAMIEVRWRCSNVELSVDEEEEGGGGFGGGTRRHEGGREKGRDRVNALDSESVAARETASSCMRKWEDEGDKRNEKARRKTWRVNDLDSVEARETTTFVLSGT